MHMHMHMCMCMHMYMTCSGCHTSQEPLNLRSGSELPMNENREGPTKEQACGRVAVYCRSPETRRRT